MGRKDPRVDAYIAKSAEFARPILLRIRELVHRGCPRVQETLKWGMPSFEHRGILCGMAAFKAHCALRFWKGSLILDRQGRRADEAMGQFGKITKMSDLPSDRVLLGHIRKAARLNEEGVKVPGRSKPKTRRIVTVPPDLAAALGANAKAAATFEGFSPTNKKEYVDWITEAKTGETRARRLATAVEWMSEGKARNWKYARQSS